MEQDSFWMYNMQWPGSYETYDLKEKLYIEDYCWMNFEDKTKMPKAGTGHDKFYHFKRSVDLKWNDNGEENFIWTEWSEKMIRSYLDNKAAMWGGASNCGKSYAMAAIALTLFCADPQSLIQITSTSLDGAKKRVWGAIQALWRDWMPGFKSTRLGKIIYQYVDSNGKKVNNDSVGVHLVAFGDREKALNSILGTKAQGNHPYLLVFDELSELPLGLADAWISNASVQPTAKIIAASNPTGTSDNPFGLLSTPKIGWDVVLSDEEKYDHWETTTDGVYLRFDGFKNPLIIEEKEGTLMEDGRRVKLSDERKKKLSRIFTPLDEYAKRIRQYGSIDNPFVRRFYRALFTQGSSRQAILDLATIRSSGYDKPFQWDSSVPLKRIASVDPSFTESGDRSVFTVAEFGRMKDGRMAINVLDQVVVSFKPHKLKTYNFQQAEVLKDLLERWNVPVENFAVESTGSGASFGDILSNVLGSNKFYRCVCAGSPSRKRISSTDSKTAKDIVTNRISEMWLTIKSAFTSGQVRGKISSACLKEMTSRFYSDESGKFTIESKRELKRRGYPSPDFTDSLVVLLDFCRTKFGFVVSPKGTMPPPMEIPVDDIFYCPAPPVIKPEDPWTAQCRRMSSCFKTDSLNMDFL